MIKRLLIPMFILASLVGSAGAQEEDENSCVECHLEQDPPYSTPAETFATDIHAQAGFTCVDCHGGDPTAWDFDEAKDPATGFSGVPAGQQIIRLCGRCHSDPNFMRQYNPNLATDQVAKYWTSGHGKSLRAGNTEVAVCTSCHTTHSTKRANDPGSSVYHRVVSQTCGKCHANEELMSKFELPVDIVEQYEGSVHGMALLGRGDVAAPTCNDCHGNHAATPPEVSSIQEICGTCHVNNQLLFGQSKMRTIFTAEGFHGCETCHTAHDIQPPSEEMVGIQEGTVCSKCHVYNADDPGGDPGGLHARYIRDALETLKDSLETAEQLIAEAENRGLEVDDLILDMQSARTSLIQSRTMVHTFDATRVAEESRAGISLSTKIIQRVELLMQELRNRKVWLGIATIFVLFTATMLHLYVKTLD